MILLQSHIPSESNDVFHRWRKSNPADGSSVVIRFVTHVASIGRSSLPRRKPHYYRSGLHPHPPSSSSSSSYFLIPVSLSTIDSPSHFSFPMVDYPNILGIQQEWSLVPPSYIISNESDWASCVDELALILSLSFNEEFAPWKSYEKVRLQNGKFWMLFMYILWILWVSLFSQGQTGSQEEFLILSRLK